MTEIRQSLFITEVLPLDNGYCLIRASLPRIGGTHTEWVFKLPPIEYRPKVGDHFAYHYSYHINDGQHARVTEWQINDGPWVQIPILTGDFCCNTGTYVGWPLHDNLRLVQ